MIVKGLCISDIHFGVGADERIYNELSIVKDYIQKNDLNVIHINGDFFDRKLSFNEPAALLAMQFFYELRELCIKRKIKLRIVHGTLGHERHQTDMFKKFESKYLDMKIYDTVGEEELFPGFKVLYIPEEYPVDADEYYAPYKKKQYQAIMGHGMWDFVAVQSVIEAGDDTKHESCPVLKVKDWESAIPHGFAMFGHIHARHVYKKKFFYPGSFSSWDFTDISDKGFAVYSYDTEKKYYNVKMVNNKLCPTYGTVNVNKLGLDLTTCSVQDIQAAVAPLAEKYDFFRLDVDNLSLDKVEIIKLAYKNNGKIKIKKVEKKTSIFKESEERFNKWDYILKGVMPIEEVVLKYIKEEMSGNPAASMITIDTVKEALDIENKKEEDAA